MSSQAVWLWNELHGTADFNPFGSRCELQMKGATHEEASFAVLKKYTSSIRFVPSATLNLPPTVITRTK